MQKPIIVTLPEKFYRKNKLYLKNKPLEESLRKNTRPYIEGTLCSIDDNTVFVPFRTRINSHFMEKHPDAIVSLTKPPERAGLDISKMIILTPEMIQCEFKRKLINDQQYQTLLEKQDELWDKVEKYVKEYKREVRAGERLRPEYRYTSLQYFHEELGLEKMEQQTERELDMENLKQLQEDRKIDEGVNIEHVADQLPSWRESKETSDKELLAKYGRGSDLDKLVNDDDINVVIAVADRGRDKDLDKLVSYED